MSTTLCGQTSRHKTATSSLRRWKHFYFPWAQLRGLEFTLSSEDTLTHSPVSQSSNKLSLYLRNVQKSWDDFDPQLVCPGNRVIPLKGVLGSSTTITISRDDPQFLPGKYMLVGMFDAIDFRNSWNLTSVNIEEDIWNMMFWWNKGAQTDRRPEDPSAYPPLGRQMFEHCYNLKEVTGAGAGKVIRLHTGQQMFNNCSDFDSDVSGLKPSKGDYSSARNMFHRCQKFNNGGESMNSMDVGGVKDLNGMFRECSVFNADISGWTLSQCEDLTTTFSRCYLFNQNIGGWDVKNVTNVTETFRECTSFDQNLGAWDVGNVTDMTGMFYAGEENGFNNGGSDSIKNWDTGKVKQFRYVFADTPFNQPIGSWDTGAHVNADSFYETFADCEDFDQDLTNWCVNRVNRVPDDFATGTKIENDLTKLPVWGTCP